MREFAQSISTVRELLACSGKELPKVGLAAVSLLCAEGLYGADDVDVPKYLARVKEWAAVVRREFPKYVGAFQK